MRCLGLDLGTKTLGIAISDKNNIISSFYKVLRWDGEDYDILFKELDIIIKEKNIGTLVLGLPKNMNNSMGFASERSLKFKEALNERYQDIDVVLIDERLTTIEAENYLLEADMSRKKRKKVIDGVAATIILETYLRMKGNKDYE